MGRPTTNEDADVADAPPTTTVKVAAEEKVNLEFSELGGWDVEAKYKNDGSLSYDIKTTALRVSDQGFYKIDTLFNIKTNQFFHIGNRD